MAAPGQRPGHDLPALPRYGRGRAARRPPLQQALAPLGIAPDLQIQEISAAAFLQDPLQSNQVLIAGQPIEHWLGGQAGRSRCCNECGDNDCRTLEVGGQQYEAIPEDLLVRAALVAASRMLDPTL